MPRPARHTLCLLLISACEGAEEAPCDPRPIEVEVAVIDVTGAVVVGAQVELLGVPCDDLGGGGYLCTTDQGGRHDLFVYDFRWRAHAEFLELPEPGCELQTRSVDVLLVQGMGL